MAPSSSSDDFYGPLKAVVIDGKRFNVRMDMYKHTRCLWLEDNDTKYQWLWRSTNKADNAADKTAATVDEASRTAPEHIALAAIHDIFYNGASYERGHVELNDNDCGREHRDVWLTVHVPVATTGHRLSRKLTLTSIPQDDKKLASARQRELCQALAAVRSDLTALERTRAAADKQVHEKLEGIFSLVVVLVVVLVVYVTIVVGAKVVSWVVA